MTRLTDVCLILPLWHGMLYLQSTGALCSGGQHNLVIYRTVSEPTNSARVTAINSHNIWIIKPSYAWGVVFGTRSSRLVQNYSFFPSSFRQISWYFEIDCSMFVSFLIDSLFLMIGYLVLFLHYHSRPQWQRGLRYRYATVCLLGSWVRIPPGTWTVVCCECCVLSGRDLCDELTSRPDESCWLWCV